MEGLVTRMLQHLQSGESLLDLRVVRVNPQVFSPKPGKAYMVFVVNCKKPMHELAGVEQSVFVNDYFLKVGAAKKSLKAYLEKLLGRPETVSLHLDCIPSMPYPNIHITLETQSPEGDWENRVKAMLERTGLKWNDRLRGWANPDVLDSKKSESRQTELPKPFQPRIIRGGRS